jgi:hypothetical protein
LSLRRWFALGLGLSGLVFLFQGLGFTQTLYPSFMNNDLRWSLVGIAQIIAALFLWQRKSAS